MNSQKAPNIDSVLWVTVCKPPAANTLTSAPLGMLICCRGLGGWWHRAELEWTWKKLVHKRVFFIHKVKGTCEKYARRLEAVMGGCVRTTYVGAKQHAAYGGYARYWRFPMAGCHAISHWAWRFDPQNIWSHWKQSYANHFHLWLLSVSPLRG